MSALVFAWAQDSDQTDRVPRNVTLAGQQVGGLRVTELEQVVQTVAASYAGAPVEVQAPGGGFESDGAAFGLSVQVGPTVERTLGLGQAGSSVSRILSWVSSFFVPRLAPVQVSVNENSVHRLVAAEDPGPRTPPKEPGIEVVEGTLQAVEGTPGKGIDAVDVIDGLPGALGRGMPLVVTVDRADVAPRLRLEQATRLLEEAEALTASGLDVKAGSQQRSIPPRVVRTWLGSRPTEAGLQLVVNQKIVLEDLQELLPKVDPLPQDARFAVEGDQVTIVPGQPGLGCCADAAGETVELAIRNQTGSQLDLPFKEVPPNLTAEGAAQLGIKEQVATFTTNFRAGQPRVRNIQLMADLVRGQIIKPAQTFSINDFVGERTPEKGFVAGGVIEDGEFTEDVGGGISQFATTIFNAAFFAGLDFPDYQSHSIYISRYPYGREATLSFPAPDLKIQNTSPFNVLVWTSYTESSITVNFFSTKWVEAAQTAQTRRPRGPCTLVRTERTLRFVADGTTRSGNVNALYRPAEGVNCT